MTTAPLDLLCFSPHPDDAELGCGGTLASSADAGARVGIVDLTAGEKASRGTPGLRKAEAEEAARLLGLATRRCLGLPDAELGLEPSHRLAIVEVIRELRPSVVLAPPERDRHPDHAAAGRLVREACFLAGVSNVEGGNVAGGNVAGGKLEGGKLGEREPFRPRRVYGYMLHHPFVPKLIVDVTSSWERRMAAVRAYRSQFEADEGSETALSGGDFLRAVEARAIHFGSLVGAAYGEPFECEGPVGVDGLPGLDGAAKGYSAY